MLSISRCVFPEVMHNKCIPKENKSEPLRHVMPCKLAIAEGYWDGKFCVSQILGWFLFVQPESHRFELFQSQRDICRDLMRVQACQVSSLSEQLEHISVIYVVDMYAQLILII